jgi:hypothetical protein
MLLLLTLVQSATVAQPAAADVDTCPRAGDERGSACRLLPDPLPFSPSTVPSDERSPAQVTLLERGDLSAPALGVNVDILADGPVELDWLEWGAQETGDTAFGQGHIFNCQRQMSCRSGLRVISQTGRLTVRARVQDVNGLITDWVSLDATAR